MDNEKKLNFFDRFLYKFILGLLLLLAIVLLDYFSVYSLSKIQNKLSENYNLLKTIQVLNGNINFIDLGTENEISVTDEILIEERIDNNTIRITIDEMSGVKNYIAGIVVKIEKKEKYEVSILGIDDKLYIYKNLDSIDHYIYEYLKTEEIIGNATSYYDIYISG